MSEWLSTRPEPVDVHLTDRRQGMVTLNDALLDLVERNLVEPREAYLKAVDNSSLLASLKVKGHATDFMGEG
ncbi:MAG: hypothetical protein EXR94_02820 [Gemmatimonadetes bacterium]|nr:hypothetical protein [Gemmatimonadota bacterium]